MQYAAEFRVETKTREQAAYEVIRQAIVGGRWQDGQSLVASRIATELGVSRITVANAFKRLSGEGFIKLVPHKEAIVAPLDAGDIRQIYLMRAELEALSARESATRATTEDIAELKAINDGFPPLEHDRQVDVRQLRALDMVFHKRLRTMSAMPLLATSLNNLADQGEGYRARLLDSSHLVLPTRARHMAIIAALEAHDSAAAADAMRIHVHEGMEAILSKLDRV